MQETIKRTVNYRDTIYNICIFCAVFVGALQSSMLVYIVNFSSLPLRIEMAVCFIMIVLQKYKSIREICLTVAMITIGVISYWESKSTISLGIILFSLAAKGINYKKILKTVLWALVFSIASVIILNQMDLFPKIEFLKNNGSQRLAYGFLHPNTFSLFLVALNFCYYACRGEKITIRDSWLALLSLYITIFQSQSSTASIALILFLSFILLTRLIRPLYQMLHNTRKLIKWTCYLGLPILIILLTLMAKNNSNLVWLEKIGSTANLRLHYAYVGLQQYGISFFGQPIPMYGTSYFATHPNSRISYFVVDCLYIILLIRDGLLASICIWGISLAAILKCIKSNNWSIVAIIGILYVYSVMETGLSNIALYFVFIAAFAKVDMGKEDFIRGAANSKKNITFAPNLENCIVAHCDY